MSFLREFWMGGAPIPDTERDALRRAILAELRNADPAIEREHVSPS